MDVLARMQARVVARDRLVLPPKPAWARAWLEFPLNALGFAVGRAVVALPASAFQSLHAKAFGALAGSSSFPSAPGWPERLAEARSLHDRLAKSGPAPAVFVVMSHPPVDVEVSTLNFEMTRRAFLVASELRGRPTKTRLVVAVDPFALDAAPFWQEGLYPGVMTAMHVALDRQPSLRGPAQRLLLAAARPERAAWRLLRTLGAGGEAAMMLAGGVEQNARVLYPARELLARWKRRASRRPRANGSTPFEALDALAREEPSCAETGRLSEAARGKLRAIGRSFGLAEAEVEADLDDFSAELVRRTPLRRRLFSIVARRVAKRRPVLIVPISHGRGARAEIALGRCEGWTASGGKLKAVGPALGGWYEKAGPPAELAASLVREWFD